MIVIFFAANILSKVQVNTNFTLFVVYILLYQWSVPAGPSPQLVQSLLSLCDSTRRLGIARHPARQKVVVQDTLRLLITSWINEGWETYDNQALHDLAFLHKIADVYGSAWEDISTLLAGKLKANVRCAHLLIFCHRYLIIFCRLPTLRIMKILKVVYLNTSHGLKRCSQDYSLRCRRRRRNLNCYSLVIRPLVRIITLL